MDDLIELNASKIETIESLTSKKYEYLFKTHAKVQIGKSIRFIKGKQPNFVDKNEGMPYLIIDDLVSGNSTQYSSEGVLCNEDDVLMVMDGASSGKVFIGNKGYVGSTLAKLSSNKIPASVLYFGLRKFEGEIMKNTTGSAIPHTDKSFVSELQMVDDVHAEEKKFFDDCLSMICKLRKENTVLNAQKEILLHKYFD